MKIKITGRTGTGKSFFASKLINQFKEPIIVFDFGCIKIQNSLKVKNKEELIQSIKDKQNIKIDLGRPVKEASEYFSLAVENGYTFVFDEALNDYFKEAIKRLEESGGFNNNIIIIAQDFEETNIKFDISFNLTNRGEGSFILR